MQLYQKETPAQVFLYENCEILKNSYSEESSEDQYAFWPFYVRSVQVVCPRDTTRKKQLLNTSSRK